MKSFAISYDLIGPNRDYNKLYDAIRSYGSYARITESFWLVNTSKTCVNIRDYLKDYIDKNDKLLVLELQGDWAATNLPTEIVDWLKSNV